MKGVRQYRTQTFKPLRFADLAGSDLAVQITFVIGSISLIHWVWLQWLWSELYGEQDFVVKLAFISALVFEISQLQSAQDRVVLARNNAIIVRSEHYELVAMRDPGPKKRLAGSVQ